MQEPRCKEPRESNSSSSSQLSRPRRGGTTAAQVWGQGSSNTNTKSNTQKYNGGHI